MLGKNAGSDLSYMSDDGGAGAGGACWRPVKKIAIFGRISLAKVEVAD